jgi:hypothetical protein
MMGWDETKSRERLLPLLIPKGCECAVFDYVILVSSCISHRNQFVPTEKDFQYCRKNKRGNDLQLEKLQSAVGTSVSPAKLNR